MEHILIPQNEVVAQLMLMEESFVIGNFRPDEYWYRSEGAARIISSAVILQSIHLYQLAYIH